MIKVNKIVSHQDSSALRIMGNQSEEELLIIGVCLPHNQFKLGFVATSVGGNFEFITPVVIPDPGAFITKIREVVTKWLGSPSAVGPRVEGDLNRIMRAVGRHFWVDIK